MKALPKRVLDAVGPREPGGVYLSGYWGCTYRVEQVLVGEEARAEIPWSDLALVVVDLDGPNKDLRGVHCTPWDPARDQVVEAQP